VSEPGGLPVRGDLLIFAVSGGIHPAVSFGGAEIGFLLHLPVWTSPISLQVTSSGNLGFRRTLASELWGTSYVKLTLQIV
jgi:hypothetical protein